MLDDGGAVVSVSEDVASPTAVRTSDAIKTSVAHRAPDAVPWRAWARFIGRIVLWA